MTEAYQNEERLCECWKCELSYENGGNCPYANKYQRLPRDLARGGLGHCLKLPGNERERLALEKEAGRA